MSGDAVFGPRELAEKLGIPENAYEALRSRLIRWRDDNPAAENKDWIETATRKPREPQFLYRVGAVRSIIDELKAKADENQVTQ